METYVIYEIYIMYKFSNENAKYITAFHIVYRLIGILIILLMCIFIMQPSSIIYTCKSHEFHSDH